MIAGKISTRVIVDRLTQLDHLSKQVRALPVADRDAFFADPRNVLAAESCLRRSLEILLDLGRHILAKGFAVGVTEYKEIADELRRHEVFGGADADLLRTLAGYRNRLVHFYHEVGDEELYELCSKKLGDLDQISGAYRYWVEGHPEKLDEAL